MSGPGPPSQTHRSCSDKTRALASLFLGKNECFAPCGSSSPNASRTRLQSSQLDESEKSYCWYKVFFPALGIIPNFVVYWTFEPQQRVLAPRESFFAALRGGRCLSAPEPSCIEQTASAPTSGALLMCPFLAERPPSAVGIKGPMNFWVWHNTKVRFHLDFCSVAALCERRAAPIPSVTVATAANLDAGSIVHNIWAIGIIL